eukprot:4251715-Amphidinium_carterae.1
MNPNRRRHWTESETARTYASERGTSRLLHNERKHNMHDDPSKPCSGMCEVCGPLASRHQHANDLALCCALEGYLILKPSVKIGHAVHKLIRRGA